jgi:PE-PPE domain
VHASCISSRGWAIPIAIPQLHRFLAGWVVYMRVTIRTTGVVISALVGTVLLALPSTTTSVFTLTAATALIMGGSGHPLSTPPDATSFVQQYMGMAVDNYIAPSSTATPATGVPTGQYNQVAVITPAQFAPEHGTLTFDQSVAEGMASLDNCINSNVCAYNPDVGSTAPASTDTFVVFGYSQSATIATLEKRSLADQFANGQGPNVSFVLIANGNRANGGLLARGPLGFTIPMPLIYGGVTFSGPTPTNTQYNTVDIAGQYDGWADVPMNPLN